jgi:hypothetical protein
MPDKLRTIHKWKQTRKGLLIAAVVELTLAYGFATWAIDSGNLWLYLLTAIFLVGGLKDAAKAMLAIGK